MTNTSEHLNDNSSKQAAVWRPQVVAKAAGRAPPVQRNTEEERLRAIQGALNKLTNVTYDRLSEDLCEMVDSLFLLKGTVNLLFDKALIEPAYCPLYAKLCGKLGRRCPEYYPGGTASTLSFRRILLKKCQKEFEKGFLRQPVPSLIDLCATFIVTRKSNLDFFQRQHCQQFHLPIEVEAHLQKKAKEQENKELSRLKRKKRMYGNLVFIGELFNARLISPKIIIFMADTLLSKIPALDFCDEQHQPNEEEESEEEIEEEDNGDNGEEEDKMEDLKKPTKEKKAQKKKRKVGDASWNLKEDDNLQWTKLEGFCKLMWTVGKQLEGSNEAALEHYFHQADVLSKDKRLASRLRFMFQDLLQLRNDGWRCR
ncbi:putative eukaryotic translation initiation factor 4G-like isoform X1, variant 2 [Balamuthia mandrillaris]